MSDNTKVLHFLAVLFFLLGAGILTFNAIRDLVTIQ